MVIYISRNKKLDALLEELVIYFNRKYCWQIFMLTSFPSKLILPTTNYKAVPSNKWKVTGSLK